MIYETLEIVKQQLHGYFLEIGSDKGVVLGNIGLWDSGHQESDDAVESVVITLLRIEEETVLKNTPHYKIQQDKTEYRNPPINLNLYISIAANFTVYKQALRSISDVVAFFQGNKTFTSTNTVYDRDEVSFNILDSFKFNLEFYSPSFEELNNIWGTLGGKQLPSVMYKVQLIQIERDKKRYEAGVITQIKGTLNEIQE